MKCCVALALVAAACGSPDDGGRARDAGPGDAVGEHDLARRPDMALVSGPKRLSDTGLYADIAKRTLAPGVQPFTVRYPLWSDGAEKERWLLLPPGTKIDTSDMDGWTFPVGTKAWKEFRRDGVLVETRLLWKALPGSGIDSWWHVAYVWNDDGTDAFATPDGLEGAHGTPHVVPSQEDCEKCHRNVSDVLIGVSALQLSDGGKGFLSQLAASGALSSPPTGEFEVPGSGNAKATLAYFHANCGHCHNAAGVFAKMVALRLRLSVTDHDPGATGVTLTGIRRNAFHDMPGVGRTIIEPGRPDRSQLYMRMASRDDWSMPPACTRLVDPTGLAVVRDWILALPK